MFALILNAEVTATGNLPAAARDLVSGAWVTPPGGVWTPEAAAACGWYEVTETPRPADTAEGTYTGSVELVDGLPVRVWTWRAWTVEELAAQAEQAAQQVRYDTHQAILDATAALMDDAHTDGAAWVQPTGAHDAYALGITVTHDGKTWENITPANVWAPGVSGWREVVAEGYPAWVQPTGAQDAYNIGDRVSFEGANYESKIDGNTWSPTAYPAGWQLIIP